jgi:lysophospholipase L1-like esterase
MRSLTSSLSRDGIWGLGGVTFDTDKPSATAWVGPDPQSAKGTRVASFDLSYLRQPNGGSLDVLIDSKIIETLSTRGDSREIAHRVFETSQRSATLAVRTHGDGSVRLFGAVLESDKPGIIYDTLAINGVRIANFRRYDEAHFAAELKRREANLVVMMCGANEGNNDALALGAYRENLSDVLERIRRAVPNAGCLVVGPLDQAERSGDGTLVSKKMPRKLTRLQREVSQAKGCAFFDTYNAMGGKDSMPRWFRRGLVGADFIHPTETGAKMVGSWLTEALLAGYENFLFNGEQCELNVTSL